MCISNVLSFSPIYLLNLHTGNNKLLLSRQVGQQVLMCKQFCNNFFCRWNIYDLRYLALKTRRYVAATLAGPWHRPIMDKSLLVWGFRLSVGLPRGLLPLGSISNEIFNRKYSSLHWIYLCQLKIKWRETKWLREWDSNLTF